MRALSLVWSEYTKHFFNGGWLSQPQRRARRRRSPVNQPRYAALEVLETRAMLSAAPTTSAVMGVGSAGNDGARAVATDNAGDTYVTGNFSGTVNFNPNGTAVNLTSAGAKNGFVAEYSSANTLLWVQPFTGSDGSGSNSVTVDGSGNVYVAGSFSGNGAAFGSTILNAPSGVDGFVTKLNSSGAFQWAENMGTTSPNFQRVAADASGNVYAMESMQGGAYTILKYSSNGALDWSKSISANEQQVLAGGFAVDSAGDVIVAGDFLGTVNFNPGGKADNISSGPSSSGFVLELNTNGNLQWVSPFVGQTVGSTKGSSVVYSVALDSSGNIDVGGSYNNTVDFDPGRGVTTLPTVISSGSNGFIVQLNSSGGLNWARGLVEDQSNSSAAVYALNTDSSGAVYATGQNNGTIDLNPGSNPDTQIYSSALGNGFVVSLSAQGGFNWGGEFGGTGYVAPIGIAVAANGTVDIIGNYQGTADFSLDPNNPDNLTSAGGDDMFVFQLN